MKRIRRSISPLIIGGVGVWMLVQQDASIIMIGWVIIALSALSILLSVTDRENSRTGKVMHSGLGGVCAAGGACLLVWPQVLEQHMKYILVGIIILYSLLNLRRMHKYHYRRGFQIAECFPVIPGAALMLIPLEHPMLTAASGGVMAATGVITLIGNLFGKSRSSGEKGAKQKAEPEKPAG